MTLAWAIVLGFVLGLRHATDADHVAAIGTMLHREPTKARAARLAAFWGLGHTITFAALGVAVIALDVRMPPRFERFAEIAVAAMLVVLGAQTLARLRRPRAAVARWRPMLIGVIHGLAGSAGVSLLALTTISSRAGALTYLALFGAGTVAGMVLLTVALSVPLRWGLRRHGSVPHAFIALAALASMGLGVAIVIRS